MGRNRVLKPLLLTGAVIGLWYLHQRMTAGNRYAEPASNNFFMDWIMPNPEQQLRYFTPSEFGDWWPQMSTKLLMQLDEFRHQLGVPVMISPAPGALGRNDGPSLSQHNVDMWGEVRAADVMFQGVTLEKAVEVAKEVGFSGIGAYPDWNPRPGLHLDVRPAPLALWSGIKSGGQQVYRGIAEAFA